MERSGGEQSRAEPLGCFSCWAPMAPADFLPFRQRGSTRPLVAGHQVKSSQPMGCFSCWAPMAPADFLPFRQRGSTRPLVAGHQVKSSQPMAPAGLLPPLGGGLHSRIFRGPFQPALTSMKSTKVNQLSRPRAGRMEASKEASGVECQGSEREHGRSGTHLPAPAHRAPIPLASQPVQ